MASAGLPEGNITTVNPPLNAQLSPVASTSYTCDNFNALKYCHQSGSDS
jgi:hypothetical protein